MEDLWLYYTGDFLTNDFHKIYGVQNDKCGYPMFLIRQRGQWFWRSASEFIPEEEAKYKFPEKFMPQEF